MVTAKVKVMGQPMALKWLNSSARLAEGGILTVAEKSEERCQNPLCGKQVSAIENGWRRTERRFCSDLCKQQASILKRAAAMLEPLGKERAWEIISGDKVMVVEAVDAVQVPMRAES
jgi:hypothetical protein